MLLDLEKQLSLVELDANKEMKAGGDYMFELLAKTHLAFDTYLPIYQIIDASIGYLTSGG